MSARVREKTLNRQVSIEGLSYMCVAKQNLLRAQGWLVPPPSGRIAGGFRVKRLNGVIDFRFLADFFPRIDLDTTAGGHGPTVGAFHTAAFG